MRLWSCFRRRGLFLPQVDLVVDPGKKTTKSTWKKSHSEPVTELVAARWLGNNPQVPSKTVAVCGGGLLQWQRKMMILPSRVVASGSAWCRVVGMKEGRELQLVE